MNLDYQKIKENISPDDFLQNLQDTFHVILSMDLDEEFYDKFTFGKHKGKPLSLWDDYHFDQNYVAWCLYVKRKDALFIQSLCKYNQYARDLAKNPAGYKDLVRNVY